MNNRYKWMLTVTALILGLTAAAFAQAEAIQWEGNGHFYEYVPQLVNWEQAMVYAEDQTLFDNAGYLVTLTSQAENDFVFNVVLGGNADAPWGDPWIGGYQNSDHSDPAANWHWVTEEPFTWVNWAPGEPNDYDETWAEMYLQFSPNGNGMWNDHHSLNPKPMIIEYSNDVVATEQTSWGSVKSLFR